MDWAAAFGLMAAVVVCLLVFTEVFDQLPAAMGALVASWLVLRLGEGQPQ